MNKTAIKTFAIWARNKLIDDITYKAGLLGITDKEIKPPLPQSTITVQFFDIGTIEPYAITGNDVEQRRKLVEALANKDADHPTAFKNLVEEVAYTWFNRLIAVRFMEVNDYLPTRIRVLSSESPGKREPDLVTHPFDAELSYSQSEKQQIAHLQANNLWDELFRMLFIKQCNALNAVLPELFEKTNDYTELLMNVSFTDQDGVVFHLINDIDEDDFNVEREGQVEIIGWLYQAYITEINEMVYDGSYAKAKITKELLPAATQLFTPDWPIRYMVENSLGRLWLEGHPNESLKTGWKYYLDEAEQEPEVQKQLEVIREEYKNIRPEDIKIIDPCMGSGHILVYAFDVLMAIYESVGYSQRDAAKSILENNIFGLDIDTRAYQLAYFALMMKARAYNRRILNGETRPNVYAFAESNGIKSAPMHDMGLNLTEEEYELAVKQAMRLVEEMHDAKEYGSILNITPCDWDLLRRFAVPRDEVGQIRIDIHGEQEASRRLQHLINVGEVMVQKYDVVVTNPPYLGSGRFNSKLIKYVNDYFSEVKSDLSMVMFKKALESLSARNGLVAFITTSSWMFLKSFEKIREEAINNYQFETIVDFGTELFDGKVGHNPIVAWINRNRKPLPQKKFIAIRLVDYCYSRRDEKQNEFFNFKNRHYPQESNFSKIPGMPIAYWVSEGIFKAYETGLLMGEYGKASEGIKTGNNDLYLKLWFEVEAGKFSFMKTDHSFRWYPHHKGGEYRKWYGNLEWVVNWENDGESIKASENSGLQGKTMYFKPVLCWSKITSKAISLRYVSKNCLFDSGSPAFRTENDLLYCLGFLNSVICSYIIFATNPTLNCQVGNIKSLPLLENESKRDLIGEVVEACIIISKTDWDSFETSWDFKTHPLLVFRSEDDLGVIRSYELDENDHLVDTETILSNGGIQTAFERWQDCTELQFNQLKANEEELNRIFIDIYGLQDELTPEVEDKDVTIRRADSSREIRSFISYAVGCMFGRYSLDTQGLAYAGGEWDSGKYQTFIPDQDNVLPITDEEYFEDDVVGLFVAFVKKVYGEENLENNLDFIANALGNKGNTAREIIRNYFLKDFFKDHCKVYQKRPIYWLFDSGKENGFKALIYLHRYNADTIGNLRIDYLHRMQKVYESEMARMQETIDNSTNPRDVSAATKRKEKLIKQLKETKEYDEKIAHLALARIELDLDDGVKVNYEKVQTDVEGRKLGVLAKI